MALSSKVTEELLEAKSHLRNALKNAAVNEKSTVTKQLADILLAIDTIEKTEMFFDKLQDSNFGDFNSLFGK